MAGPSKNLGATGMGGRDTLSASGGRVGGDNLTIKSMGSKVDTMGAMAPGNGAPGVVDSTNAEINRADHVDVKPGMGNGNNPFLYVPGDVIR